MFQRFLFGLFYRIGFTPWEGHKLSRALGSLAQEPGKLLDIGCGAGDTTIDLAQKGWQATGIDFVEKALQRARKKAAAAKVEVRFLRGDATKLSSLGLGADFDLVTDNGCMHLLDDAGRDAWAREVTAVTAPGAHLLVVGFLPGNRPGPKASIAPRSSAACRRGSSSTAGRKTGPARRTRRCTTTISKNVS